MEAQITAGMKTPVLSCRPGPEGSAGDKGTKRDGEALSKTHSVERAEQVRPSTAVRTELTEWFAQIQRGWGEKAQLTYHLCVLSPSCEWKVLIWSRVLCHCCHKGTLHIFYEG